MERANNCLEKKRKICCGFTVKSKFTLLVLKVPSNTKKIYKLTNVMMTTHQSALIQLNL